jgi:hypothetical protein
MSDMLTPACLLLSWPSLYNPYFLCPAGVLMVVIALTSMPSI